MQVPRAFLSKRHQQLMACECVRHRTATLCVCVAWQLTHWLRLLLAVCACADHAALPPGARHGALVPLLPGHAGDGAAAAAAEQRDPQPIGYGRGLEA